MNFDELLKYCMDLNESSSDKCLVCHIPIEKYDTHIKLKCTHIFHPECVKYTNGTLKCLYCDKVSTPIKINYDNIIKQSKGNKPITNPSQLQCKVILKSGPQKGNYCNRTNCKYHKLNNVKIQIIDSITKKIIKPKMNKVNKQNKSINNLNCCQQLIKTGIKVGTMCGRNLPCKYHKIKNVVIESNNLNDTNKTINSDYSDWESTNDTSTSEDLIEV